MRLRSAAVCLAASLAAAGCATVRSTQSQSFLDPAEGATYFLPMRLVTLTVTPKNTPIEKLISDRDELVVSLAAARAAIAAATAKRLQQEAVLNALSATSSARPEQARLLELAVAEEKVAKDSVAALETRVVEARTAIVNAQTSGSPCRYDVKLELLPVMADPRYRFVALPRHNELRDDVTNIAISPAGLLTSASVTNTDQTGQVLVELSGLAGTLAGLQARGDRAIQGCTNTSPIPLTFDPTDDEDIGRVNDVLGALSLRLKVTEFNDERSAVQPAGLRALEAEPVGGGQSGSRLDNETAPGASNGAQSTPTYQRLAPVLSENVPPSLGNRDPHYGSHEGDGFFYRSAVPIIVELLPIFGAPQSPPVGNGAQASTTQAPSGGAQAENTWSNASTETQPPTADGQQNAAGSEPVQTQLSSADSTNLLPAPVVTQPVANTAAEPPPARPTHAFALLVPQAGPISYIPIRATPFVKTGNEVTFVDGGIAVWNNDRPSAIRAAIMIPSQMVSFFVQKLGEAFTIRGDWTTRRETLRDRQMDERVRAEQLRQFDRCMDIAERDHTDPTACLPDTEAEETGS